MNGRFFNRTGIISLNFRVSLTRVSNQVIFHTGGSAPEAGHKQAKKGGGERLKNDPACAEKRVVYTSKKASINHNC